MKITVITNAHDEIIGTFQAPESNSKDNPVFKPMAKSDQKVHEIDLPSHLENVKSAEELHKELKKHLSKT